MKFSLTIQYYYKGNFLCGHTSFTVENPEKPDDSMYYSWARRNNYVSDLITYGQEPIEIKLPCAPISYDDFFNARKGSPYFYDENNSSYGDSYRLFKNNCAHSAQHALYFAGYTNVDPGYSFALRPYEVAQQACQIALAAYKAERENIIADCADKPIDHATVVELVNNSINRLNIKLQQKKINHLPSRTSKIKNKIAQLRQIADDVKSTESNVSSLFTLFSGANAIGGTTKRELNQVTQLIARTANDSSFCEKQDQMIMQRK